MMTPTARIDFRYELKTEDGNTVFANESTVYGAFEAEQWLIKHGIKLSYATILKAKKERTYMFSRFPYWDTFNRQAILIRFSEKTGLKIIDAHLCFKRI